MNDFNSLTPGLIVRIHGVIFKVIRRDGCLRLVVDSERLRAFANFETDVFKEHSLRKGKIVTVEGKITFIGSSAICLSDCKIIPDFCQF